MCGRFSLAKDDKALRQHFTDLPLDPRIRARYNIAPTQPVVAWVADPVVRMEVFTWGLIPPWAKDPAFGAHCINAWAETVATKPSFKSAFLRKRCLIPADGWYEWKKNARGQKQPYWFHREDRDPFVFAGLWEEWHDREGGLILSCTVITTRANRLVRTVHPRMPAILREEEREAWLNPSTPAKDLFRLLEPVASDGWTADPVSMQVNSARAEGPELIQPVVLASPPVQGDLFGGLTP
jgi:putative SOS response-associated peptidase YedK